MTSGFGLRDEDEYRRSTISIRRVTLRLRAGVSGFDTEEELGTGEPIEMPAKLVHQLRADPCDLLGLRVRDRGMEPLLFEDDWVVIDTGDTKLRSGEVYAVNWNGEACVQQLTQRGGQWYLSYLNPDFKSVNVRSGQLNIVGRAVYQPGRLLGGRL
jgi:SOS-response transcriptional repressor LexA